MPTVQAQPGFPSLKTRKPPLEAPKSQKAQPTRFKGKYSSSSAVGKEETTQRLVVALSQSFAKEPSLSSIPNSQLIKAIENNQALPLPKGYQYEYGLLLPDGTVQSPFKTLKAMVLASTLKPNELPRSPQPIVLKVRTPQTDQALKDYIDVVLKKEFSYEYKDKNGIVTNNVILSDLLESLISGKLSETNPALPSSYRNVAQALNGKDAAASKLGSLMQLETSDHPELAAALTRSNDFRQKLLGLELARKVYAESQDVEWHSIALSLALGVVGEPTINHIFKDGGPVASFARTTLMSGIDIMGNILSVMGVVNENLKARGKKLSLKAIYGEQGTVKDLFNPQGEAGPDIKQGVKAGVLGGLLGVLFNIPAGSILSMPNADVTSRAIIGGIGAAGSAVAIPPVIKSTTESFKASIEELIKQKKVPLPPNVKKDTAAYHDFVNTLALKEMNARIGIASSIKATHPIPLAGTGAVILAAEKLGIPREYVQTAYMAIAPVMHNFLRLGTTGLELFWTIPRRMRKLENLVYESKNNPFDTKQMRDMDQAFLTPSDRWISNGLSQMGAVVTFGTVLLAAEVLSFTQARKATKKELNLTPRTQNASLLYGNPASSAPLNMRQALSPGLGLAYPFSPTQYLAPLPSLHPPLPIGYRTPFYSQPEFLPASYYNPVVISPFSPNLNAYGARTFWPVSPPYFYSQLRN